MASEEQTTQTSHFGIMIAYQHAEFAKVIWEGTCFEFAAITNIRNQLFGLCEPTKEATFTIVHLGEMV